MQDDSPARPTSRPIDRAMLELISAATADWFALYDVEDGEFRHRWVDPRSLRVEGRPPESLVGLLVSEAFPPEVAERFTRRACESIEQQAPVRYETEHDAGQLRHIEVTMAPVLVDGECAQLLVATRDVSDRRAQEDQRDANERRLRKLMENAPDIVWLIGADGSIVYATAATRRLLGYDPADLIGKSSFLLVDPSDIPSMQQFFVEVLAAPPGTPFQSELRTCHRDGSVLWTECTVTNMLDDPDVGAIVVNAHDVTERKQVLEQLAHHALHDMLTGLPNRALVTERLDAMLANADAQRLAAAFFVDFDGFKLINDTLGHGTGDQVIRDAARRLVEAVGPRGTVARFGGDEFVIAANQLGDLDRHLVLGQDIRAALSVPFVIDEVSIYLTASVGFATSSTSTNHQILDADTLLRNADMAMYEAKRTRLASARLFDESLHRIAERRLETMNRLRSAIERNELVLHFQPVFDLAARRAIGVEALVRWNHPVLGLVPPAEFIDIAEETGLIVPIGDWVLNAACDQVAAWARQGLGRIHTAVNVSPKQLADPSFVRRVRAALARSGIAPSMLTVEITENLIMEDPDVARDVLDQIADLGVRVAIDDFGRGYSSLAYLAQFPAHQLKIDRLFVSDLGRESPGPSTRRGGNDATLVHAIIDMAHALGLEVVAEGVETPAQLDALRSLGCEFAQGYLLGRPVPAAELDELFAEERRRTRSTPGQKRIEVSSGSSTPDAMQ